MAEPNQPVLPANGQDRPAQPQGRFIVVFGTKGGVGKTVVATNLAASLAQRIRKPVCLVDLDMIAVGDACKMLGVTATRSIVDLMPVLRKVIQSAPTNGGAYAGNGDFGMQVPLPIDGYVVPHASGEIGRAHV